MYNFNIPDLYYISSIHELEKLYTNDVTNDNGGKPLSHINQKRRQSITNEKNEKLKDKKKHETWDAAHMNVASMCAYVYAYVLCVYSACKATPQKMI